MSIPQAATRACAVGALAAALLIGGAAPSLAHVDLVSSTPTDGAAIERRSADVTLVFSQQIEIAGEGIVLMNANAQPVSATVSQPAPTTVVIDPDRRLQPGGYAVVWTVRAGDAHPRTGAVSFDVTTPSGANGTVTPSDALEQVLADVRSSPSAPPAAGLLAAIGRWAGMAGTLLAIGGLGFGATTLVGRRDEVVGLAYWVRRAGLLVAIGGILELAVQTVVQEGSVWSLLSPFAIVGAASGSFGIAVMLRVTGGIGLLYGVNLATRNLGRFPPAGKTSSSSGTGTGGATITAARAQRPQTRHRLDLAGSPIALLGGAAVMLSYLFDGHSVTTSPVWVVRAAGVAHVTGASVWLGGVAMLAWVLARRKRRAQPLDAGALAVRFSRVAAAALVTVGVAGVALALTIVDDLSEFVTTPWGRLLLVKTAVIGIAAGLGGYNHRYVVPTLADAPGDEIAADRLRRVVRIEAIVLLGVVAVTAILVAAAS